VTRPDIGVSTSRRQLRRLADKSHRRAPFRAWDGDGELQATQAGEPSDAGYKREPTTLEYADAPYKSRPITKLQVQ
jgi:hypothetical protein